MSDTIQNDAPSRAERFLDTSLQVLAVLAGVFLLLSGLLKLVGVETVVTLFEEVWPVQWDRPVNRVLEVTGDILPFDPNLLVDTAQVLACSVARAIRTPFLVLEEQPVLSLVLLIVLLAVTWGQR